MVLAVSLAPLLMATLPVVLLAVPSPMVRTPPIVAVALLKRLKLPVNPALPMSTVLAPVEVKEEPLSLTVRLPLPAAVPRSRPAHRRLLPKEAKAEAEVVPEPPIESSPPIARRIVPVKGARFRLPAETL